jgi:hypothetical protein
MTLPRYLRDRIWKVCAQVERDQERINAGKPLNRVGPLSRYADFSK